jgi:hypothetical protein
MHLRTFPCSSQEPLFTKRLLPGIDPTHGLSEMQFQGNYEENPKFETNSNDKSTTGGPNRTLRANTADNGFPLF